MPVFFILVSFFLRVCPTHLHFLILINCESGLCRVLLHSSLFEVVFGLRTDVTDVSQSFINNGLDVFAGSYCFSPGLRSL